MECKQSSYRSLLLCSSHTFPVEHVEDQISAWSVQYIDPTYIVGIVSRPILIVKHLYCLVFLISYVAQI